MPGISAGRARAGVGLRPHGSRASRRRRWSAVAALIAAVAAASASPATEPVSARATLAPLSPAEIRATEHRLLSRCRVHVLLSLETRRLHSATGPDVTAKIVFRGGHYDYRWQLRRHATFCGLIVTYVDGSMPTAFPRPTHRSVTGGDYVDETARPRNVRVQIVARPA